MILRFKAWSSCTHQSPVAFGNIGNDLMALHSARDDSPRQPILDRPDSDLVSGRQAGFVCLRPGLTGLFFSCCSYLHDLIIFREKTSAGDLQVFVCSALKYPQIAWGWHFTSNNTGFCPPQNVHHRA
jgi:hypothetical protein